jgi:hypothetical protein
MLNILIILWKREKKVCLVPLCGLWLGINKDNIDTTNNYKPVTIRMVFLFD